MKKTLILGLALALIGGVAYANFCARDVVPAATLLVPYGVVDLNADGTPNVSGYTTLFAVTNVSSTSELVHFTVWSAKSNPVVDWDALLTGYDVLTINFRDLFTGHFDFFDTGLDNLAPDQGDPYGPSTNNAGIYSQLAEAEDPDVPIAGCNFPYKYRPTLGPIIVGKLKDDIGAQDTQDSEACRPGTVANPPWLVALTANPVFFYVTADVVRACNVAFPNETGYWTAAGGPYPIARNVLIGDVIWVNSTTNYSESIPAVHLEATNAGRPANFNTFYNRYAEPFAANDNREPLATAFGFRYIGSGASTQVMVWKDSDESDFGDPGVVDACVPYAYYAFDENENALARGGGGPSGFDIAEPNVIPFETQSAPLDANNWDGLPAANGWMLLVFDTIITDDATNVTGHQAWVGVRYLSGGYSTALEAATLGNYNCYTNQVLPRLGIDEDSWNGGFPTTLPYLP